MTPRNLRWFRFSLRTFLAATTILALLLAWLTWHVHRAREQGRVLADLQSVGGFEFVGFKMPRWSPEWLKTMAVFHSNFFSVNRLTVEHDSHLPDDALRHMARLPELDRIKVRSDTVTDEGLRPLLALRKLRILAIASPRLTDHCLSIVGQMKHLEELAIDSPQITAEGLAQLKRDLPACQVRSFDAIFIDGFE